MDEAPGVGFEYEVAGVGVGCSGVRSGGCDADGCGASEAAPGCLACVRGSGCESPISASASAAPATINTPAPIATFAGAPSPSPTAAPTPPAPPAPPAPAPSPYQINELTWDLVGDGTKPEVRMADSSWLWQRQGLRVGGKKYRHGVTVHAPSSVTIDLHRQCTAYDAYAGVDDLGLGLGVLRFSVYADGQRLWRSGVMRGGRPAVPVHVPLTGHKTVRLVVEPASPNTVMFLGDWAQSQITCK
ncbi:NPCBM/NEW2 domain-containing protein [Streptomyces capuensis]|uniref:NPCBM/NEW2 domain-containing protein n=1 Tax=Streptomyces capuensis TaxID=1464056 RepID=UPI0004C0DDDA|nr:NPCBM/NEW2 domain-containing protein [Streptomyces capuensis]